MAANPRFPLPDYPFAAPETGGTLAVADGVHWLRMPLPFDLAHINLWLLQDGDAWVIVDTGLHADATLAIWDTTLAGLMANRRVRRIVATHMHPDHAGNAGWLCRRLDATLYMTREEYLYCRVLMTDTGRDTPEDGIAFYHAAGFPPDALTRYQKMFGMFGRYMSPLPDSYRRLQDGDTLTIGGREWQVIVGNGHSPEHACLYDPAAKLLLSGDQVLPTISSNVGVYPTEPDADPLADWLASIDKLRERLPDDVLVLPAHGKPSGDCTPGWPRCATNTSTGCAPGAQVRRAAPRGGRIPRPVQTPGPRQPAHHGHRRSHRPPELARAARTHHRGTRRHRRQLVPLDGLNRTGHAPIVSRESLCKNPAVPIHAGVLMRHLYRSLFSLAVLAVVACAPGRRSATGGGAPAAAGTAAVAMPDGYGADVAEAVLRDGGNAVDAAVAAGFALAVTYPEAGNIGGGGFMLIHMDGRQYFLDYRETAPLAAHRDMYLDDDGNVVEGASLVGHLAVGVPGTVAGLWEAHRRFGTLPWERLVRPAVRLARDGFVVAEALGSGMKTMDSDVGDRTNFGEYFGAMTAGEVFRQPELAATLARIAVDGPEDFYRGETADLLVAEMQRGNGLITHEDLAAYEPAWREPLRANWRNYELIAAPPPSSGGFAVIQLLKIKDYLAHQFEGLPHNSPQYIHLVAEIEKRVFADRAEYLGDPDYVDNRMDELLAEDYIEKRAREVNPHAISTVAEAPPGPRSPDADAPLLIQDADGNAVSNTYTLNLGFGSGVVVDGAGFPAGRRDGRLPASSRACPMPMA
ncbi:MAG: gamma-glutamyltransferase [Woeseiaceae bacterium]|nr:gamma-glutamyltransferase [Woeseiaceae bacterium]